MTHAPAFLEHAGRHVAFEHVEGHTPGVVFLGGFKSSMRGLKSQALYDWCCNNGIAFTRLDYAGHGESSGEFTEFHLGDWLDDALAVFDTLPHEQSIVVGSSMGGWLAVLHIDLDRFNFDWNITLDFVISIPKCRIRIYFTGDLHELEMLFNR